MLVHCRDGGANCLLTITPFSCAAQHYVGDVGNLAGFLWSWWRGMLPFWRLEFGFRVVPVYPGLLTSDHDVHEVGVTVLWSRACPMRLPHKMAFALIHSFRHFPYNENLTRALNTTSFKWRYWQAGKNSRMRVKVRDHIIQACFIAIHQVFGKRK